MTTEQKAELLKSMQKLDYELRLRRYPAVLETEAGTECDAQEADDVNRWEGMSFEQAMEDMTGIASTGPI